MARRFAKVGRLVAVLLTAICFCACVENDVNRGNEALRIGDYDRAVANFSKALDMQPANRDARYGLALAYYSIAEENERLKVPVLETWQRTVTEFRILSMSACFRCAKMTLLMLSRSISSGEVLSSNR